MFEPLDLYCERCDPSFWAEPFNAFSNFAFVIAAVAVWWRGRRQMPEVLAGGRTAHPALPWPVAGLVVLAGMVAVGSALFHTFATRWAMVLDVTPILVFQVWFLWFYLRIVPRLSRRWGTVSCTLFLAAHGLVLLFPRDLNGPAWLNGSLNYLPTLVVLGGLGLYQVQTQARLSYRMLGIFTAFALAVSLRTVDLWICEWFPVGTHFAWHLINGVVFFLSIDLLQQQFVLTPTGWIADGPAGDADSLNESENKSR